MSNTKTEAQRLADFAQQLSDEGPKIHALVWPLLTGACLMFSDELRSLDAENQQLRAQLSKAVAEEREACAKVCDGMANKAIDGSPMQFGLDLAADAIRARSNT